MFRKGTPFALDSRALCASMCLTPFRTMTFTSLPAGCMFTRSQISCLIGVNISSQSDYWQPELCTRPRKLSLLGDMVIEHPPFILKY